MRQAGAGLTTTIPGGEGMKEAGAVLATTVPGGGMEQVGACPGNNKTGWNGGV